MNLERRTWIIGRVLAVLLMLVSLRAAYWQLIRGRALDPVALDPIAAARIYAQMSGQPTPDPGQPEAASLAQLPQPVIQRTIQLLSNIQRGSIYDRNGVVLAEDTGTAGDFTRVYADPSLAHTIGYVSAIRTGVSGLEATYNRQLLGLDRADTELNRLLHRPIKGSSLVLTIDGQVQQAAAQALGSRAGAVIALDGKTGAVLAMVSSPSFDPNRINSQEYSASLKGSTALLNRVTQALYTPGSIFKTVTLITSLDTGVITPDSIFDFGQPKKDANGRTYYTYEVGGGVVYDANHPESKLSVNLAFAASANAAFAKLGYEEGADKMIEYGQRLGFSTPDYTRRFPLELQVSEPQLANDLDALRNDAFLRASTGYGQGELLVTPINMAMVMLSVENGGSIPIPYLVQSIKDPQGNVVRNKPNNHLLRNVYKASTAAAVRKAMQSVVYHFQVGQNLVPGAVNGGKTGTAQLGGSQNPHGWYMGYSEMGNQTVIVVVELDDAPGGSAETLPIYAATAKAALAALGK